jgi:lipoyl(octanoyl) transferase
MGRRGQDSNIVVPEEFLREKGVGIHRVERGGDVTYHGPGQLVVYPVFDLCGYGKDIRSFVHNLQKTIINVLAEAYGIEAVAETGTHTGVYVGSDKIAAIGLAVRRWVTMHGFAFNINTDLSHFDWIVPCGLQDRGVTSVEAILGRKADFEGTSRRIIGEMEKIYGFKAVETDMGELV